MSKNEPIKVLIVDDSATVRAILARTLRHEPDINVVGCAADPFEAREMIISSRPGVIILDIEMPRMDGLTFLRKLRQHYPVPVIMCSGVATADSHAALEATEIGAIDFVVKPSGGGRDAMRCLSEDLADKIRAAAMANPVRPRPRAETAAEPDTFRSCGLSPGRFLVAVGASTGGTEAIKEFLSHVPADFPPVVMVQHMPAGFTRSFAERLNRNSRMTVTEAVDGDLLEPGRAFLARGEIQMAVARGGNALRIVYGSQERVNRHCPSVDVLFDSVARHVGNRAVGVLLTGMGDDGAKGLLNMKNAGAATIAQDKESCVVYGMPKVAVELGAVERVGPPARVPKLIVDACRNRAGKAIAR